MALLGSAVASASAATFALPFASALTRVLLGNSVVLLVGRLGVELDRNVTAQIQRDMARQFDAHLPSLALKPEVRAAIPCVVHMLIRIIVVSEFSAVPVGGCVGRRSTADAGRRPVGLADPNAGALASDQHRTNEQRQDNGIQKLFHQVFHQVFHRPVPIASLPLAPELCATAGSLFSGSDHRDGPCGFPTTGLRRNS